jgi:hypothetical protein
MVKRNFALWKPVRCANPQGEWIDLGWARVIDKAYKGTLLTKILEMPRQRPISFEDAINLIEERKEQAFKEKDYGMKPGQYGWYIYNFVQYLSDLGYHIELTGDEIESYPVAEVRT